MRHATTAPGTGDPPEFRRGHCRTRRNLSDKSRAQARRIGQAFVAQGMARTACGRVQLLFPGRRRALADSRSTAGLGPPNRAPGNVVLVTHQVNTSALTGEFHAVGEPFMIRPPATDGCLKVLARQRSGTGLRAPAP